MCDLALVSMYYDNSGFNLSGCRNGNLERPPKIKHCNRVVNRNEKSFDADEGMNNAS